MSFVRYNNHHHHSHHHRGSIPSNPPPGFSHHNQHFMQSSSSFERRHQHNYHDRFDNHKNRSERLDGRMREPQHHYPQNDSYVHHDNQSKEIQPQESSSNNNPFSQNSSFSSPLSTVQDAYPTWRKDEKQPYEEKKRRKSPYARDSSEHAEEPAQTISKTKVISKTELPQHKTLKLSKKFDLLEFVKKQQLGRVCFQNLSNKLNNRLIPILPQHLII